MASAYSSDEDSELTLIPDSVTDYQFVDEEESPISFSDLPLDDPSTKSLQVYLCGTTKDKLQKVFQPVTAWKLELSRKLGPEVFVLSNGKWVKLMKPRKAYESVIRGVLISIQALHFLKWNPDSVEKNLWDNLRRFFDKFEVRPSEDDFRHHITFMKQFAEKDKILAKSQVLKGFLEGKGRRRTGEGNSGVPEVKQPFIAGDDEVEVRDAKGDESEEDADLFDSVCSICDNGGDLLCCEGECMRSFHATEEAGDDSNCESLGFTSAQVEAIQNFLCENCKVKQHQCFACGKLGNSDKSKGAEVFQCSNATCGYFYHPSCVAKLLFPDDEGAASQCEKTVLEGRFVCPSHRCAVCKKLEDKADPDFQFAICRRCPKSYHRKCLPRKISFTENQDNGILIRAWEDLLPNRILIYCLKHKMDKKLMTPSRDHIMFPETATARAERKVESSEVLSHKQKPSLAKRHGSPITTDRKISPSDRRPLKKRAMQHEEVPSSKGRDVGHMNHQGQGEAVSLRKVKKLRENDSSREEVGGTTSLKTVKKLRADNLIWEESNGTVVACSASPSPRELAKGDLPSFSEEVPCSNFPETDAAVENRMKKFLEKESVTVNDVLKRQTIPQTHQYSGRQIEKVTRGKIEGSVEAIQTAYQRIIDGGSVEDAKAICEPEVVKQVVKWHKKLGVYLSPFMYGMRYTSFGRHFTKEEKLQEICNKLQWYVKNNDTIVDFCCGSNAFSRTMKERMDALGKRCNYRNYDIVPPKNDFCYEKRDWMTVRPKELPNGESLIMGLNPPYGTKAGLANKFIDKALMFKPKLVILIVPKETERLDRKRTPYDLVWVDSVMLSGMSFYLPGSVDVNDKLMEQWNVTPPLLYLWSRPDWTARHKDIAEEHGHFSKHSQDMPASPPHPPRPSEEEQKEAGDIISQVVGDISVINNEVMEMKQQEYVTFSKGKDKLDHGPREMESQVRIESTILKQKEGKDASAGATVIEEVKKSNDRNQGREKKGSLEVTGPHREARGMDHQNEGKGGSADQNSGASSPLKESRANKPDNKGTIRGSHKEYTDNRYHNGGATQDQQEPQVIETHNNFREAGPHRAGKLRDVREGSSYNNKRSPDTRDIKRSSPEMRPRIASHIRRRSPPGVVDRRSGKRRQSEDKAAGTLNGNISDMDLSPENNRQHMSAMRGDNTTWENNNLSRYDSTSSRGNGSTHLSENNNNYNYNNNRYDYSSNRGCSRENNNTACGDTLHSAGSQYINNDPLMEQLIETRQLDSHLDFSDLGPILSNGNDDLNDMARQYPTSSSYDWAYGGPGLGSGSGFLEHNHPRVPDYMDPGGFDDFEGLSRFYGSHDENRRNNFGVGATGQPGHTFYNGTSIPYGLSGLGGGTSTSTSLPTYGLSGLGGSTSTSAMDRYAPKLDETNILRPGVVGSRQFHQGVGGFSGLGGSLPYSYDRHGLDRRDIPPSDPDLPPGFGPRHLYSFHPPPGSSGGWLGD